MTSTVKVTLIDGVTLIVPDSLSLITPYVLQEQLDWFEDEIKFVRRLLRTGQKVIDIGANYGVYALSMAKAVGPGGRVWAFEPASDTASILAEGSAANGFEQVILEQSALSCAEGTAQFSQCSDPEANALVRDGASTSTYETVRMVTLDSCMERFDWRAIDFIKIDAEGEEANILKGGHTFFAELSPLVMYEIKSDGAPNMNLVREFSALGYDSFRLVPGLDLLIPFDPGATPDGYLLNLFCCKPDRIADLASQGFLLATGLCADAKEVVSDLIEGGSEYGWRQTVAALPYGARLASRWETTTTSGTSEEVERALAFYALSRDNTHTSAVRFMALEASYRVLRDLCERQASNLRLASLARVARDFGERSVAVAALRNLSDFMLRAKRADLGEPFLSPGRRFDIIDPGESIDKWILAAVLEELERMEHYSSFYGTATNRARLETIRDLGFGSAEMERRLHFFQKRFGKLTSFRYWC